MPVTRETLKDTKLYLERKNLSALKEIARAKHLTVSALVRLLITEYVREETICH